MAGAGVRNATRGGMRSQHPGRRYMVDEHGIRKDPDPGPSDVWPCLVLLGLAMVVVGIILYSQHVSEDGDIAAIVLMIGGVIVLLVCCLRILCQKAWREEWKRIFGFEKKDDFTDIGDRRRTELGLEGPDADPSPSTRNGALPTSAALAPPPAPPPGLPASSAGVEGGVGGGRGRFGSFGGGAGLASRGRGKGKGKGKEDVDRLEDGQRDVGEEPPPLAEAGVPGAPPPPESDHEGQSG
eukprot:Hpha_TRINITY_DN15506_c7_g7::TRINITY_DN15506_c7_g7_i1::g.105768::m.105768